MFKKVKKYFLQFFFISKLPKGFLENISKSNTKLIVACSSIRAQMCVRLTFFSTTYSSTSTKIIFSFLHFPHFLF
ncbi:unnamed protein product [Meloidogyne enterolobii]|uniref:Uncharacterized protein n=1 Tax=Meloidogyne enterolobii TaxID=390850 RepID=A0ACB1A867_MELEN